MRLSHKSLVTIFLVWGVACLSQIYCTPISHARGSDVQLAKPRDERLQLDLVEIPTSVPEEFTTDVHASLSPSQSHNDSDNMFKFWYDMYIEYAMWLWEVAKWLWSLVEELTIFIALQVLPLALFFGACVATTLGAVMLVIGLFMAVRGLAVRIVTDVPTERTRLLR
ncbi:hypothetical protein EV426DRAFT_629907 [Tirmania nivea]|nr:hypothetical protein EV426DRAFT_629907 [Tirmania nivea]